MVLPSNPRTKESRSSHSALMDHCPARRYLSARSLRLLDAPVSLDCGRHTNYETFVLQFRRTKWRISLKNRLRLAPLLVVERSSRLTRLKSCSSSKGFARRADAPACVRLNAVAGSSCPVMKITRV